MELNSLLPSALSSQSPSSYLHVNYFTVQLEQLCPVELPVMVNVVYTALSNIVQGSQFDLIFYFILLNLFYFTVFKLM